MILQGLVHVIDIKQMKGAKSGGDAELQESR